VVVVDVVVIDGADAFPAVRVPSTGVLSTSEADADDVVVVVVVGGVVVVVGAPDRTGRVAGLVARVPVLAAVWTRSGRPVSP
jgi:hypothetical protein